MDMHIAVCDDNVADRKQMERLLARESDRRSRENGLLYTDSFGNASALLHNPMQYDIFFLDVCRTEGVTVQEIVAGLLSAGVKVPIYLCCSEIDYRQYPFPENIFFIDKAIRVAELTLAIDRAAEYKQNAVPLLELRLEDETLYVTEEEILYAVAHDGKHVAVTLTDQRKVLMTTSIENLYGQWEKQETMVNPTRKLILNARHVASCRPLKVTMTDGTVFTVGGKYQKYIIYIQEKLSNQ